MNEKLIECCDIGAQKAIKIEPDVGGVLIHVLSSDASGVFCHISTDAARKMIAALQRATRGTP